jgi:hypothetical protein
MVWPAGPDLREALVDPLSLMAMIVTMAYAPVTLFVKSANIAVMRSWITEPFDLAIKNSSNRWKDLLENL